MFDPRSRSEQSPIRDQGRQSCNPYYSRFSLGEESRFEDHDPSPFCVLKHGPCRETFPAGESPQEKRGQQYFSRDVRVLFGTVSLLGKGGFAKNSLSRSICGPSSHQYRSPPISR